MASTVGLATPSIPRSVSEGIADGDIVSYAYQEPGYRAQVECVYNQSSALELYIVVGIPSPGGLYWPQGIWANGSLPNGNWPGLPTWAVEDNSTVVALASVLSDLSYMYGFVGGNSYGSKSSFPLDKIQCEVTFIPTSFQVQVAVSTNEISVSVLPNATQESTDIDSSRGLVNATFFCPSSLSQILTTGYTSVFGDAFKVNADNVRARELHNNLTSSDILAAAAEGIEQLIDGCFGSIGAAQLMLSGDTRTVEGKLSVQTMRLGEVRYIYSIFAISTMITLLLSIEALRTRLWRSLPSLNSMDLKSSILATASGGNNLPESGSGWDGDAADRTAGAICAMVRAGEPEIILQGKENLLETTVRESGGNDKPLLDDSEATAT